MKIVLNVGLYLQLAALFSHEDQESGDVTETAADDNPVTVSEVPDLPTVDQILESVSYMLSLPTDSSPRLVNFT